MQLGFFTEESYEKLVNDISANAEKYMTDGEWLTEYFGNNDYYKISTVEVDRFTPSYAPGKKDDAQKSLDD